MAIKAKSIVTIGSDKQEWTFKYDVSCYNDTASDPECSIADLRLMLGLLDLGIPGIYGSVQRGRKINYKIPRSISLDINLNLHQNNRRFTRNF